VNSRPLLEVADILRQYGDDFRQRYSLLPEQRRVMRAIEVCRTSVLGGHLGAELGFLAVLHTWSQTLRHHPHLHCVVPGGGLSLDGMQWLSCRPTYFLPVKVLARLFRRLFLAGLQQAFVKGQLHCYGSLAYLAQPAAFAR
jgi:Putative transposase